MAQIAPKSFMDFNFGNNNQSLAGMSEYIPYSFDGNIDSGSTGNSGSYMDLSNFGTPTKQTFGSTNYSSGKAGGAKGFDTLGLFGAGAQGLSALGSLLQAYNGAKQLKLGQDTFKFQKNAFNQDAANQAKMVNSELEDRQKSRISSTGNNNSAGVYEGLDSYLNKNRVTVNQL